MVQSKIIKFKGKYSDKANLKELYYRNNLTTSDPRTDTLDKWYERTNDGRKNILKKLVQIHEMPTGKVLEIGAGSCWLSCEISKEKDVEKIYSVEFSEYLLTTVATHIMKKSGANVKKIIRVLGDFNNLEFENNTFDYILFDASMHHATDLTHLLKEATRVLKNGGKIIAIREPVIPYLRPNLKKSFGKEDREHGITEKIYTINEWKKYFKNAKLKSNFIPYLIENSRIKKILNIKPFTIINKLLFGHYIFILKKSEIETKSI